MRAPFREKENTMTYAKHIVAAAALLASFGVAHAENSSNTDRAAFYQSLQNGAAASNATVIEGRQATRIAQPTTEARQAPLLTDADRYVEQHNIDLNH
jgi:hypothetical protein